MSFRSVVLWVIFPICYVVYRPNASAIPTEYLLSFPTTDNYLNINISTPYSNNYFIIIGDWGAPDYASLESQQLKVANKLKYYVSNQTQQGKNLLFIVSVGDNFYMAGQDCTTWDAQWRDVYGDLTTDYHWFGSMGNHDWGYNDLHAMCPWNNTKYTDPNTSIPYASNILNANKGGCAPDMWEMPDFGYVYTIDALKFELIVLDQNSRECPGELFCQRADICMACPSFANCYDDTSDDYAKGEAIGCDFLDKIRNASETMMQNRSMESNNTNFVLAQHYPSYGKMLLDQFNASRTNNDIIVSVYGHEHKQNCDGTATDSLGREYCNLVLSGGGGGCCQESRYKYERSGFYVMGFDDDAHLVQLMDIFDNNISFNNSGYPGNTNTKEITHVTNLTIDGYQCPSPEPDPTSAPSQMPVVMDSDSAVAITATIVYYCVYFVVLIGF
eukprot:64282_1